jgi:acetolactate synthase-1/2/3 large subunit
MGCVGLKVDHPAEIDPVIEKMLSVNDRPVVLEVVVDGEEMCFPMVPAGGSNDRIVMSRDEL